MAYRGLRRIMHNGSLHFLDIIMTDDAADNTGKPATLVDSKLGSEPPTISLGPTHTVEKVSEEGTPHD